VKKLLELFMRCLNANYVHTENAGDYSIEVDGRTLYLYFQWSSGREDWKNNFNFPGKAYKNGANKWFCHRGFLKVWKSIREQLEPRVLSILKTTEIDKIVCVGYSHGAALAGLATEDMEFIYGSCYKVSGYGFGCPRFVFGILPRAVKKRFKHFTPIRNIPDLVTHVPPFLWGYGHGGKLLRVGRAFDFIKLWKIPFFKFRGAIKAHYAEKYISELEKLSLLKGKEKEEE